MKPTRFMAALAAWALCIAAFAARAADLVVIDLNNRRADEVIPVLRPLVGADVALSGMDYKLIVRGTAVEVARIKEALAVLDRAPRQLLISVRYTGTPERSSTNIGAGLNADGRGNSITVRGGTTTRTAVDSNTSSVRVLEGNSAHISSGQSVPIVTAFVPTQMTNRTGAIGLTTDYREVSSGFEVRPRVNGARVVLEISSRQQRLSDSRDGINTQSAATTLSGNLGEWIELGGISASSTEQRTSVGITGGSRRVVTDSDQRSIAVKVEQVQ